MYGDGYVSTRGEKVALGAAALTALAAFLPWVSVGPRTVAGIEGEGLLTLLLAAVVGGISLVRDWERVDRIAVGSLGILTIVIAALWYGSLSTEPRIMVLAAGIGLHLTMVGGSGMLVAVLLDRLNE